MHYPWKAAFSSWSRQFGFKIDALGIVTILGADEIDACIGRLVPSRYFQFLPLIGAHVVAGNAFAKKQTGFSLYNITGGFMTSELAAWLSRWLKAQEFHQVRSIVTWEVVTEPRPRLEPLVMSAMLGVCLNGLLLALAILSNDWWGFVNSLAMATSVVVRWYLVSQNRAGIDRAVADLTGPGLQNIATVLVITDDSKVITMYVPERLIGPVFAGNPKVPCYYRYTAARYIGWIAFATHAITLGMSEIPTQLFSVVLLLTSTSLATFKCGCDDSRLWKAWRERWHQWRRAGASCGKMTDKGTICLIGDKLRATCSEHPVQCEAESMMVTPEDSCEDSEDGRAPASTDVEARGIKDEEKSTRFDRRQDLYVRLNLTDSQEESMKKWNLLPHKVAGTKRWWDEYKAKRARFWPPRDQENGMDVQA